MTKIEFQVRRDQGNKILVCSPAELVGKTLPPGFVSAHEHGFSKDGTTGWVEVPTSAVANGEVSIIGVSEETWEAQKLREAREEYGRQGAAGVLAGRPGRLTLGGGAGPSQEWVDQPEGFQLTARPEEVPLFPDQVKHVQNLEDEDNEGELFEQVIPDERPNATLTLPEDIVYPNKPNLIDYDGWDDPYVSAVGLLWALGFRPRPNKNGSVHKWYHLVMGDDRDDNRLLFDPETDTLESLGVKLIRLGARLGTRQLKMEIKAALENH